MEHHTHTAVLPKVSDLFTGAFKSAHASLGMVWNLMARFIILPGVIVWAVSTIVGIILAAVHSSPMVAAIISGVVTAIGMFVKIYYQLHLARSVISSNLVNPAEDAPTTARGAIDYTTVPLGKFFLLTIAIVALVYGFGVLLVVPGIIVAMMVMFSKQIFVLEQTGIRTALARSRAITDGHKWGLFGRLVLVILMIAVLVMIITALALKVSLLFVVLAIPLVIYLPGFLSSYTGQQFRALVAARPAAKKEFKKWVLIVMPILAVLVFVGGSIAFFSTMKAMSGMMQGMPADPAAIEQMMNDPEFQKMDPESQQMILDMMKNGTAAVTAEPTDPVVDAVEGN